VVAEENGQANTNKIIRNYTFVDVISKHNKETWNSCSHISELHHAHINIHKVM